MKKGSERRRGSMAIDVAGADFGRAVLVGEASIRLGRMLVKRLALKSNFNVN